MSEDSQDQGSSLKPPDHICDRLLSYDVNLERGFLPAYDPAIKVPDSLLHWQDIAYDLPKLLVAQRLHQAVHQMPIVSTSAIEDLADLERAMLAFSFIGHAYVWGGGAVPQSLPASVAVPWTNIANKLGRPPVLSYASYALHNWRRVDLNEPIELGNICLVQTFLGGLDEEWFILVHVDIEAKVGTMLASLLLAQDSVSKDDATLLTEELRKVERCLSQIYASLLRMPERCDPYIYYNRVRPYIHGWKDQPALSDGLIYKGVSAYQEKPQKFRGETGAQSSIIPAVDAALGIEHKNDFMRHYLNEMRDYMPPKHKQFIEALECGASIRSFVAQSSSSDKRLSNVYNKCVHWIELFRTKHLEYATNYVFKQHELSASNPTATGTGGTPFIPYLEKHRDETAHAMLKDDEPSSQ
jgi:indoleamine 2,3-dioxygenase